MAATTKAPALSPKTRVRKAARLVLSDRLDDTWSRAAAAAAGEPEEGIHKMRVAAKRLREAMRLFAGVYERKAYQAAVDQVDELNDYLGVVRDGDVLLLRVRALSETHPGAMLAGLADELTAERELGLAGLAAELSALDELGFQAHVRDVIWTRRFGRGHPVAGQRIRQFSRAAIGRRISPVVKRLAAVEGESDAAGLHGVRVANKKLRYIIEPFLGLYGRRLADAFGRVLELHETLGDLHDIDVLIERVGGHSEGAAAVEPVLAALADERHMVYQRVLTFCENGATAAYGRQIADAID